MTRICRVCKIEKQLEEFTKHKKMKLGYDTICLKCNCIHSSEYNKANPEKYKLKCSRYYRRTRTEQLAEAKKRYEEFVKRLSFLKDGKFCTKCGYNKHPQILHFHHRNEIYKKFGISESSVNMRKVIMENPNILQEEIDKCDLLCPNCHAELHHLQKIENKKPLF